MGIPNGERLDLVSLYSVADGVRVEPTWCDDDDVVGHVHHSATIRHVTLATVLEALYYMADAPDEWRISAFSSLTDGGPASAG